MIETDLFCDLADTLLDIETKLKKLITEMAEKCMPEGYKLSYISKLDTIALTYRVVFVKETNSDKIIHCDFTYKNNLLNFHTACVNMFNQFYVYPDKPYHLKCSNASEDFPYDENKLKETLKIFDSLTDV